MKIKSYLFQRVFSASLTTGSFSADDDTYMVGCEMSVISGAPIATAVLEQTRDGGSAWTPVITFTMDVAGDIFTPMNLPVAIEGGAIRGRLVSITNGQANVSLWVK